MWKKGFLSALMLSAGIAATSVEAAHADGGFDIFQDFARGMGSVMPGHARDPYRHQSRNRDPYANSPYPDNRYSRGNGDYYGEPDDYYGRDCERDYEMQRWLNRVRQDLRQRFAGNDRHCGPGCQKNVEREIEQIKEYKGCDVSHRGRPFQYR